MYYCINHIINTGNLFFNNSILINYNNSQYNIISTFEKNSNDLLLLFEHFDEWINKYIYLYNFNTDNFMFVSNDVTFFSEDLSYILELYYKKTEPNPIYYKNYSIASLFKNVYGFTFKTSLKVMKNFLNISVNKLHVQNIECNVLLYIFVRCLNDYGKRIHNFEPNIIKEK
jgi:hypothetical protein